MSKLTTVQPTPEEALKRGEEWVADKWLFGFLPEVAQDRVKEITTALRTALEAQRWRSLREEVPLERNRDFLMMASDGSASIFRWYSPWFENADERITVDEATKRGYVWKYVELPPAPQEKGAEG